MRTTRKIHPVNTLLSRISLRSNPDRPVGFLNHNRRFLIIGSIAACGMLTSMPVLDASAEAVEVEVYGAGLQSFAAPASYVTPIVVRDTFGVTEYTLVQWPVPANTEMSSAFGFRDCSGCSSDHKGIDLNPGNGYPVQAVADGTVLLAEETDAGLGVNVLIQHTVNGQTFNTIYGHMQFGSLGVSAGQVVARGTQLGLVGSTGASTGPHLHFGVTSDGVEIDPYAWLATYANS
jgi:murein DD-endopeptidase MepM/ murein hydrolase activator NlpD